MSYYSCSETYENWKGTEALTSALGWKMTWTHIQRSA